MPFSCATVFVEGEIPKFISLQMWHPSSPDLNPVDYTMWSIGLLQEKVYKTHIADLYDLKRRIRTEWVKLDHVVIAATVRKWRHRLSTCVRADGSHFEHCF